MMHCPEMVVLSILSFFAAFLLFGVSESFGREPQSPGQEGILSTIQNGHPRLFLSDRRLEQLKTLAQKDALLARLMRQVLCNAGEMLTVETIRHELVGPRLLGQSRDCIERVWTLSLAYRWTGKRAYLDRAVKEMKTAAAFPDWNPSHFLDVAEMTAALAVGYDWLYDDMDEADRAIIREAVVRLGLAEGMKVYEDMGWWVRRENNWNQVCNGGLTLGALAVADDHSELSARIVNLAVKSLPYGMMPYRPEGAYPEGPVYWGYGTIYNCLMIDALDTALGKTFEFEKMPGFPETGWFHIQTIGPSGLLFNYADCNPRAGLRASMFHLSRLYRKGAWAWWFRRRLDKALPQLDAIEPHGRGRFFPMTVVWYDPSGNKESARDLPTSTYFPGEQEVVILRSSWDKEALYFGIKAGDNRANHGHLDIGSFVLDLDGLRWASDLGTDNYNLPEYFGAKRWSYYRLNTFSHNTLVIDGKNQNPDGKGRVERFDLNADAPWAVLDLSGAYADQADRVRRGVRMVDDRTMLVQDEIHSPIGPVRWAMVTRADVELDGDRALLRRDGKSLEVRLLSPAGASFTTVSTKPATAEEKQNEGTIMLAVEARASEAGPLRFAVLMQAVTDDGKDGSGVDIQPLEQWGDGRGTRPRH